MRIVVLMKSNFSYKRFLRDLEKYKVHKHIESFEDVQECVQYWNPNIAIIDKHSPIYEDAKDLFFRFNVDVVEFDTDFESTIEEVESYSVFYDSEDESSIINSDDKTTPDFSDYVKKIEQKVEKEKEIIIEVRKEIIEKEIEKISYASIPSKIVVIGSLWGGAGSTTYASNLARAISQRNVQVSYVEYPTIKPYMFDFFNIHQKEEDEEFTYFDHAQVINEKGFIPRGKAWTNEGVQWILNDSRMPQISNWTYEKMLKLVYSINTPITIIDISDRWLEPSIQSFLHQADSIYVCLEADPIKTDWISMINGGKIEKIQRNEHLILEHLKKVKKSEGIPYEYIFMKRSDSIDIKTWYSMLDRNPISYLEYIPYPDILASVWDSNLLYNDEEYAKVFEESFLPILKAILPNKFLHLPNKTKKSFSLNKLIPGIFNKKGEEE